MSRFDPRPGRPNSVGPGKRPLHNMCPTVGDPGWQAGAGPRGDGRAGGSPNTVFDVLAYRLGEGKPLADAIKAPRVHTEGDLTLTLEATWPAAVTDRFKEVGYAVKAVGRDRQRDRAGSEDRDGPARKASRDWRFGAFHVMSVKCISRGCGSVT